MRESKYSKMDKEDLVKLLIEKDKEMEHLKHIIDVIDGWETAMHLTGDPNEYITSEKPVTNNNLLGIRVSEPF